MSMVIIGTLVCIDVTKVIQVENKLGKRTDRLNIFLTNIDKETIKDSKIWFMALLRCKAHSYRLREGTEKCKSGYLGFNLSLLRQEQERKL